MNVCDRVPVITLQKNATDLTVIIILWRWSWL